MDASRSGSGSFTVSNVTSGAVRARLLVTPGVGAQASWFSVVGSSERALPAAGTVTVEVAVRVPVEVAAGSYSFVVGAALEESPDRVVSGPTVTFAVPEVAKRPFPWWIVIVAAAAVLVLAVGGLGIWWINRPGDPDPTSTPERAVFLTGTFTFTGGPVDVDLDTGTVTAGIRDGADLSLSDTDALVATVDVPMAVFAYTGGVGLVDAADFATCRSATLAASVEVADDAGTTQVCVLTSDNRIAMMEITSTPGDSVLRDIVFTVWE